MNLKSIAKKREHRASLAERSAGGKRRKSHHQKRLYRTFRPSKIRREYDALSRPGPSALYLAMWLEIGENTIPIPGVVPVGRLAAAEALGWEIAEFDGVFGELERGGIAIADWSARLVFLPGKLEEEEAAPASLTALETYRNAFNELPPCELKHTISRAIRALLREHRGDDWVEIWDRRKMRGEAPPVSPLKAGGEPRGIQEQEQEQEQESETEAARRTLERNAMVPWFSGKWFVLSELEAKDIRSQIGAEGSVVRDACELLDGLLRTQYPKQVIIDELIDLAQQRKATNTQMARGYPIGNGKRAH